MRSRILRSLLLAAATSVTLAAGFTTSVFAQGRGGAAGRGAGAPMPSTGRTVVVPTNRGPVANFPTPARRVTDIDRVRGDEIERRRRVDDERRRRAERDERERDRRDDETRRRRDGDANRFQPFARWLGVDPERLQNAFIAAKENNPNLGFSQFFSAFVIAERANGSNPNVTAQAILRGLDSGMSLERSLVTLGMTAEEAKNAAKWAERIFNHLKP
jgi:hypothetical protein